MARSLFAAARLASVVSENAAAINVSRRSFAAAAAAKVDKKAASVSSSKKTKPVDGLVDSPTNSWVPDPVTGYYRPGNRVSEADPAEMRQRLLSKNNRTNFLH